MKRWFPLAGLALLAGCGHSPPTHFFTLDPAPPKAPAASRLAHPVRLGAVHIPPALDRPELVTKPSANRLSIDEQNQWAAPLGDMIRRTLAQDLLARLPSGSFLAPDAPRGGGAEVLTVDILALDAAPGGQVHADIAWSLLAPDGKPRLTRQARLDAPGGSEPGAQAAAISTILGHLADDIAAALGGS